VNPVLVPLLLATPWLALLGFLLFGIRLPRSIQRGGPDRTPLVTVVVPARNEAVNIEACVASLTSSDYPAFEVVVVDDRSDDGTAGLVRSMKTGGAQRLEVIVGKALPEGWLGKPWACWQGKREARGELILFTDADTVHRSDLLARAVRAQEEDDADLLSLTGRQLMETFWERLVQPQVFLSMALRFYDIEGAVRRKRWRSVVANGQFMLFRREVYQAIGGHEAVREEVVEDVALARLVVRSGHHLSVRMAESTFATRMYRSLSELVEGWSKNMVLGGLLTAPPVVRPMLAPASVLVGACLWLAPPVALLLSLLGVGGVGLLVWSATVVSLSIILWMMFTSRMRAPFWYGLLYPLGASMGMYIFIRSWARGRNVEWKGRAYVVGDPAEAE
jgi:chlorobactene glucosyltransferase